MAVFKPTYACPLPEGVSIHKHQGRKYINLKDHNGRKVRAYLTEDGKRYLKPQRNWAQNAGWLLN